MTIFKHELRQGKISLLIWTAAIAGMLAACVMLYPEMDTAMGDVSEMFATMGGFSTAFGLDKISFGEFLGFFAIECGNVLGIGGAFFAALAGVTVLAKEEKEHTAEFLLTHPISRKRVIFEKYLSVIAQVVILNLIVVAVTFLCVLIIGEEAGETELGLILLAYFLMQVEMASITFAISAFLKRSGMGIGIGLAAVFYFLNLIANMMEETKFLKYVTPFGYAEASDIVADGVICKEYLMVGMVVTVLAVVLAFWKYGRKDIA